MITWITIQQYFNLIVQKNKINDSEYSNSYKLANRNRKEYEGYSKHNNTSNTTNNANTNTNATTTNNNNNLIMDDDNLKMKNYIVIFKTLINKSTFIRKIDIFKIDIFESRLVYNN